MALALDLAQGGSHQLRPDDYRVTGFAADYNLTDEIYSGFMPLSLEDNTNEEGAFFFFLAMQRKSSQAQEKEKLLIWLNGGPGCSSMIGNIEENGPFRMSPHSGLESNPLSWTRAAHVLFVEQPIRVGFSQASKNAEDITTEKQVSHDMRAFLTSFLRTFPDLATLPVFISGESYAGFYIPWIADHIVRMQEASDYIRVVSSESAITSKPVSMTRLPGHVHINLEGVAIGNGALDFLTMNPSYAEYMYSRGFITRTAKEYFDRKWEGCLDRLLYESGESPITTGLLADCMMLEGVLNASGNPNVYNTGTYNLPDDASTVKFLNDPRIQEMLHVRGSDLPGLNFSPESRNADIVDGVFSPKKWAMCNFNITEAMSHDHPISSVPAIANIMQHIRVLMYNGALDLSCNHLGATHTLEMTNWNGMSWSDAERSLMKHKGDVFGQHYQLNNLSFLVIRGAGHFVPSDQPSGALDMIKRFLHRASFADIVLPRDRTYANIPTEPVDIRATLRGIPETKAVTAYRTSTSFRRFVVMGACLVAILIGVLLFISGRAIKTRSTRSPTTFKYERLPDIPASYQ
eukprot:CAMPEP_0114448742 /NCGR_PEP_ID=MMETSP0103-20121206/20494_1 /TAXON_ID=37642 ORGANISM="Paraphysomonas imperforata, Strain PA2" /NCGR_SAMPLE_ID=MMETSP0103 /ASSEMBLY_ACC=CAM_ASM_000201 /LENGTH=573 /DNA_ID=CAMNT_0001620791 /DNA_START=40 /DNA_END=1761 /DNA_ORIENTATION=+